MAATKTSATISNQTAYCLTHQRELPIAGFYKSMNPYHPKGAFPYCKECCSEIMKDKLSKSGTLEGATWLTCSQLGVPFIKDVFEVAEADLRSKKIPKSGYVQFWGKYLGVLAKRFGKNVESWSFDDTDVPLGEIKTVRKREEIIEQQMEEFRLLWGSDYSVNELGYLEWRYDTYTTDKALTEYQASRYRDLCLCELRIYKDPADKDAMATKAKIAHELGEDQFTVDKEKSEVEKLLEYDIFMFEKRDPVEFFDNKEMYKDYLGTESYWKKFIARPIRNLILGEKNYNVNGGSKYGENDDE